MTAPHAEPLSEEREAEIRLHWAGNMATEQRGWERDAVFDVLAEVARLRAEVAVLKGEREGLAERLSVATVCECGRQLGRGYCGVCDNDE